MSSEDNVSDKRYFIEYVTSSENPVVKWIYSAAVFIFFMISVYLIAAAFRKI